MSLGNAPLGKTSEYPERYAPEVLYPVSRSDNRQRLALADGRWPWYGEDLWHAYELSWLQPSGVPAVALGRFSVPAQSPNLIESKSFKLYLNSFNQERVDSAEALSVRLANDLSAQAGAPVQVEILPLQDMTLPKQPEGFECIDDEPVTIESYVHEPGFLTLHAQDGRGRERLCSHLLKSNCPVTGQPDWGSVFIEYAGPLIDRAALLRYIVGYRNAQDFHEHCVETLFTDLMQRCQPDELTVMACYTRRGGLDINPWRSTVPGVAPRWRLVRQ